MRLPDPGELFEARYAVESTLGEGGFARVYRAFDTRTQRHVALKVLKPREHGYDVDHAARFLRECQSVAQLADPHTLTLYDFGRSSSGLLFMVSELVEGRDLNEAIASGELDEGHVVSILLQVLTSLREAHRAGILHRDIKPSNIRVVDRADHKLRIKVLDFGLAKSIRDDQPALTATGRVIGTPRYMSPEQLSGSPLTPATDIFSLAIVATEMLAGHGARPPIDARRGVSPSLAAVVNRMGASEATHRYGTVGDVITDLRALLARPSGTPEHPIDATTIQQSVPRPADAPRPPPGPPRERFSLDGSQVLFGVLMIATFTMFAVLFWPDPPPPPRQPPPTAAPLRALTDGDDPDDDELQKVSELPACEREPRFTGHGDIEVLAGLTRRSYPAFVPHGAAVGERLGVMLLFAGTRSLERLIDRGLWEVANEHRFLILPHTSRRSSTTSAPPTQKELDEAISAVAQRLCIDEARLVTVVVGSAADAADVCNLLDGRAVVTVGTRFAPESCEGVPYLHIAAAEDWTLPVRRPPPRPKTEKFAAFKGMPPSMMQQRSTDPARLRRVQEIEKCVRDTPLLEEHRDDWLDHRDCRPRSTRFGDSQSCRIWDCDSPFAVCVAPGGRVWGDADIPFVSRSNCVGEADPGYRASDAINEFLMMVSTTDDAGEEPNASQ